MVEGCVSPSGATPLPFWRMSECCRATRAFDAVVRLVQVFEEVRNLCFGLAARAMPWAALGRGAALTVWITVLGKLLSNLFARSRAIAESLQARGVADPETYHLNVPVFLETKPLANVAAALGLAGCAALAARHNVLLRVSV
jgi:energy-coupling factor transporter transmembrane protein EcfT